MSNITPDNVEGFFYGVITACVVIFLIMVLGSKKGGR